MASDKKFQADVVPEAARQATGVDQVENLVVVVMVSSSLSPRFKLLALIMVSEPAVDVAEGSIV